MKKNLATLCMLPPNLRGSALNRMMKKVIIVLAVVGFSACKTTEVDKTSDALNPDHKNSATISAQPLPGGKRNFSVVYGNLDVSGSTWVGICNLTFNDTAGTVAKTLWAWDSGSEKGKTALNVHTCSLGGFPSQNCNTYTPTGWLLPAGHWVSWSGNYTYNTTTNVLSISWTNGKTESWNVSNPQTNIAKVSFNASNYSITHGRGYGSNAAWSTYKTIGQIPLNTSWPGYRITCSKTSGGIMSVTPVAPGAWYPDAINTTGFTYSANGLAMHYYNNSTDTPCGTGQSTLPGIVYHFAGTNSSRQMVYGHFCASLVSTSAFPCYTGQMHPYALLQVINDQGVLKGFVGVEQQDEPGYSDYQYQLKEYFQNTP